MDMKQCCTGKIEKDEADFTPSELRTKSSRCRECRSIAGKKWAQENPEKAKLHNGRWAKNNPEKHAANCKQWRIENPEKVATIKKKCRLKDKVKTSAQDKQYRQNSKDRRRAQKKERYKTDPQYRNRSIVGRHIRAMLKSRGSSKGGKSFLPYVDWTPKLLCDWIASQFEPWMNWYNQGEYNPETWDDNDPNTWKWQLDHIIPQSDLPYASMEDENFKKCWVLSNLRPLSAKQNLFDGVNRVRHKMDTGT
jgi:hypothetical protein